MNENEIPNVTNFGEKKRKQIWKIGNKHLLIIDSQLLDKLGATDSDVIFVEQEWIQADKIIFMKIKKFEQVKNKMEFENENKEMVSNTKSKNHYLLNRNLQADNSVGEPDQSANFTVKSEVDLIDVN